MNIRKKNLLSSKWVEVPLVDNRVHITTSNLVSADLLGMLPAKIETRVTLKKPLREGTYTLDALEKSSNAIDAAVIKNSEAGTTIKIGSGVDSTIKKPVVNEVTDQNTKVTGTGEVGSKVTVTIGGNKYEGKVDGNGNFTVEIPKQKPGTEISVTVTDEIGVTSEPTKVTVKDTTAPDAPTVKEITDIDTKVTGTGEVGSKVTVTTGGNKYEGKVDGNGNFTVEIPKQKPGTEVTVTLTDDAGNTSKPTKVTVKGVKVPDAPTVKEVTDADTQVTGTGEVGSKVTVTTGGNKYEGKVDENGNFTVEIPKQKPGTEVTVTLTDDAGNTSKPTKVTVKDTTAPDAPTVKEITDVDTKVTGTGEVGSKVTVAIGGNKYEGKVNEDGNFTVEIPKQKPGTVIKVTLTDNAGNTSKPSQVIVSETIANIKAQINKPLTTSHMYVTGTTTEGTAKVALYINDKFIRYAAVQPDGSYRVFIDSSYRVEGNNIKVLPLTKDGRAGTGDTAKIEKANFERLPAPTIDPVKVSTNYVTGKIDTRAKRVALYVDGKFVRYGAINSDGTYKIYKEKTLASEGAEIKVIAVDENNIDGYPAKTIVETENVGELGAPDVNQVFYGDTYITGKYVEGTKGIKLYINDKFIRYGALDANSETFKIYLDKTLAPVGTELKIVPVTASGKRR
ncbi:Ig-like domain-containing protein [Bacillus cereus]